MRKLTLLLVAVLGSNLYLLAEEPLLIRAYRAELGNFKMFEMATGFGVFEIDKLKTFQARKIAKPPFESRFFSPEGSFLNYTPWARQVGLFDETSGAAIYDLESKRLVVRTDLTRHCFLHDCLRSFLETQLEAKFELRKLPGVAPGKRPFRKALWSLTGSGLASLTTLTHSGNPFILRTPGGKFTVDAECDTGFRNLEWGCRLHLISELPGAEIKLQTEMVGVLGLPTFLELGSFDGKSTLAAAVTVREVLLDGSSIDDWVLTENGSNIVKKQRLEAVLDSGDHKVELGNGRRYQLFVVPPALWVFLGGKEGRERSPRELFREHGVPLKDSDRILKLPGGSLFAVEADIQDLLLIESITMAAGMTGHPPNLAGHFTLVESEKRLTLDDVKQGNYRVVRKISAPASWGAAASMDLQSGKWKVELEMQTDWDARSVEARFEIKTGEKIILSAETVTDVGKPVIYRQTEVEGRPRAWLFESSAQHVKDTIKAGR